MERHAIRLSSRIHVEAPSRGNVQLGGIGYVSVRSPILMESLTAGDRGILRRSEDNGRTWRMVEEWPIREPLGDDLVAVRNPPHIFFCDPASGLALRAFYATRERPSVIPWDYARAPGWRFLRMFVQYSEDEGRTWSAPEPMIFDGCDETRWMPGVVWGKNGALMHHILVGRDGGLIAPVQNARLFRNDDIVNPDADPATANPDGAVEWQSRCALGRVTADGRSVVWSSGALVTLPHKYSCDGADEPHVDYLPDGRLLMALRARTYPHTGQELPSLHYAAVSGDHGRTWSDPVPLLYDDGSYAYSPACMIGVFRAARNGRLYAVTNFADRPCVNCDPRNRLYVVEIDAALRLCKDTLTLIAQPDAAAGEPESVRFSNFRWYEDRETRRIVLFLTPCSAGGPPVAGHCRRYEIELPDA